MNLQIKCSKRRKDFVGGCYLLVVISIILSCTQKKSDQHPVSIKTTTQKQPVTVLARAPLITSLDTCPSPRIIALPQKISDSYVIKTEDGAKTIQLLPPEIRSASFFIPMQNLSTRNGLTHNSVMK